MSTIKHASDVNRIYICGMISKLPLQVAKDNFEAVEQYLMENFDYEIINPMKLLVNVNCGLFTQLRNLK